MALRVTLVVVWLGDIVSPVFSGAKFEPRLSDRCCWDGVVVAWRTMIDRSVTTCWWGCLFGVAGY